MEQVTGFWRSDEIARKSRFAHIHTHIYIYKLYKQWEKLLIDDTYIVVLVYLSVTLDKDTIPRFAAVQIFSVRAERGRIVYLIIV